MRGLVNSVALPHCHGIPRWQGRSALALLRPRDRGRSAWPKGEGNVAVMQRKASLLHATAAPHGLRRSNSANAVQLVPAQSGLAIFTR
jgi:hypothetical protein